MKIRHCLSFSAWALGSLTWLQGCDSCAGKEGAELEQCEAEGAEGSDASTGSSGTTGGEGPGKVVSSDEPSGSPDWQRDNVEGAIEGDTALHPPPLARGDEATMTFDCGGRSVSEVSFTMRRRYGAGTLELLIDGTSHGLLSDATWGGNQSGTELHFVLQAGPHEFTFVASADQDEFMDGNIPFILDAFECRMAETESGPNGYVDFDDGYFPPEVVGSWFISNVHSTVEGRAAIHPPPLLRGDTAEMTFGCDASKVEFTLRRRYGYGGLSLLVDGVDHGALEDPTWGGNQSGTQLSFVLSPGDHVFTFFADADQDEYSDGQVPYVLDSFHCSTVGAEPAPNGYVDFDDGYVPPEVGGSWLLNNSIGTVDGDGAMHPPPLEPGDSAEMTFEFEGSQVAFTMRRRYGYGKLELVIDGEDDEKVELTDDTWGGNQSGKQFVFDGLGEGEHTLTFVATADAEEYQPGRIPFVLDAFAYE